MADHLSKLKDFTEHHLFLQVLQKECPLRLEVLLNTKLYEKIIETYKQLHQKDPDLPQLSQRESVENALKELSQKVGPLLSSKEDLLDTEIHHIKSLARLHFDLGHYEESLKLLCELRRVDHIESWGELASNILLHKYDRAQSIIEDLVPETSDMKSKTWLLHSSLFVAFPACPPFFFDLVAIPKFSYTVEISSPHLVRYVLGSALLKRSGQVLETVNKYLAILRQDRAFIAFSGYFEDYDSEKAISSLKAFSDLVKEDYFLARFEETLLREAKKFFVFCQIKLNKNVEASWINKVMQEDAQAVVKEIEIEYKSRISVQGNNISRVVN